MAASPLHPPITPPPPPTPQVRPPTLPPTVATAAFTPTRVCLLHPGYGKHDNILFSLPAVDGTQTEPGLHHRTVLTAGAIIADNAFDRAYLTRDRAGKDPVEDTIPLDGMLEPGDYWLQLRGLEPTGPRGADGSVVVNSCMPPPGRPSISDSQTQPSTSSSSPTPHVPTKYKTYPVVPSFGDWQFPHGRLPPEWKQRHPAPSMPSPSPPHTSPRPPSKTTRRCYITGYQMGINECHLVPKNQDVWWANNGMRHYTREVTGLLKDEANLALLRADIHSLLDHHQIAIVPKPSSPSSPLSQGSHASAYAFAAHVLKDDDESREFCDLQYHNVAISQAGVDRLRPEFLFVRFAWAIFSHLQTFLSSPIRRYLTVTVRDETEPGSCATECKWMNSDELTKFMAVRGVSRSGSRTRKRSSSQMTQDEEDVKTSDAYQERWDRRSRSLDSADTSADDLDPDIRQISENTRWYEEVGQFSRVCDSRQAQVEENTRWYEEVCQCSQLSEAEQRHEADSWDDDSDLERGRPRRKPGLGSPPLESEGMPNLSRSFTSYGSNRSSVDFAEEDVDNQGIPSSTVPGDKVFGTGEGDPNCNLQLEEVSDSLN